MIIPKDTGHPYRLNKFIEYQHKASSVAPPFLLELVRDLKLSYDDSVMLCWYHSLAYSEISAGYFLKMLPYKTMTPEDIRTFWTEEKQKLIFGSSRRYVKNMDWFMPLMGQYMKAIKRHPFEWLVSIAGEGTPQQKYDEIYKYLSKWKYMGRFSIERFLEILVYLCEHKVLPISIASHKVNWKKGSNLTSGILNIYYKDEEADIFDKTGKISDEDLQFVKLKSDEIYQEAKRVYPQQESLDFIVIISKICSFRNLFKGRRYGGFHHDRQLEQLLRYKENYPLQEDYWNYLFGVRGKVYPDFMLGELGGWKGVRKERNKLWIKEGLTGIEGGNKSEVVG